MKKLYGVSQHNFVKKLSLLDNEYGTDFYNFYMNEVYGTRSLTQFFTMHGYKTSGDFDELYNVIASQDDIKEFYEYIVMLALL